MPQLAFLPIILHELLAKRTLPREPEPDLVMEDEDQVKSYSLAGRIDGVMSAAYLFHTAQATSVIDGAKRVVDLGCGPATQLAQIAAFNPRSEFLGIDLSPSMLESARAHVAASGLQNVTLAQGDITDLSGIGSHSVDAVISTMVLHHLPTREHLAACFRGIARVLKPGGAVYLTDFGRLKSLKSIIKLAYMNAGNEPHLFSLDYERSLRAAFLYEEFVGTAAEHLPNSVRAYRTFLVPLLVILRTPPRSISPESARELDKLRRSLPARYRRDLEDLRLFFRLGGLPEDPFRQPK
jgi:arsenite methyltransferase